MCSEEHEAFLTQMFFLTCFMLCFKQNAFVFIPFLNINVPLRHLSFHVCVCTCMRACVCVLDPGGVNT